MRKKIAQLLAPVLATGMIAGAAPVQAKLEDHPLNRADQRTDQWGLTATDWLTLPPIEIRAKAGFPGAAQRVLAAAQKGDAKAAAMLSGAYASGAGVPQNWATSLAWARKAADSGLPLGKFVLAQHYQRGNSAVKADLGQAARLFMAAIDLGYRPAAVEIALMPQVSENRDTLPIYLTQIELLETVQQEGSKDTLGPRVLRIFEAQKEFAEKIDGMPLWKDSRGLLMGSGHIDYAIPINACTTFIKTTRGASYTIMWRTNHRATNPQATTFLISGDIYFGNLRFQSQNGPFDGVTELGIWLKEQNNRWSPSETRDIFSDISRQARFLNAECTSIYV